MKGWPLSENELLQMQLESRGRHGRKWGRKKREPLLNGFTKEAVLTYQKQQVEPEVKQIIPKPQKVILSDLMAEMLKNATTKPQEAEFQPQIQIPTPTPIPEVKPSNRQKTVYFAPKPKKEILKWERPISRVPILPDEPRKAFTRPPAVYDNHKSYFGVYAELCREWVKKTG